MAEELKKRGNQAFQNGNNGEALKSYRKALACCAIDTKLEAILHSNIAAVHIVGGDWQDAAKEANEAVELNPSYLRALLRLSHSLQVLQKREDAIAAVSRALTLDPDSLEAKERLEQLKAPRKITQYGLINVPCINVTVLDVVDESVALGLLMSTFSMQEKMMPKLRETYSEATRDNFGVREDLFIICARWAGRSPQPPFPKLEADFGNEAERSPKSVSLPVNQFVDSEIAVLQDEEQTEAILIEVVRGEGWRMLPCLDENGSLYTFGGITEVQTCFHFELDFIPSNMSFFFLSSRHTVRRSDWSTFFIIPEQRGEELSTRFRQCSVVMRIKMSLSSRCLFRNCICFLIF